MRTTRTGVPSSSTPSGRCWRSQFLGDSRWHFTTVLEKNLLRVYEDLAFTPDDLPGYAGRVFDFAMANPT
jgi:hypothetical protein